MEIQRTRFLISDVAEFAGIPVPRLRSWERAGLLRPERSAGAVRVYGVEEVALARLIKRSLDNPGRRGSLQRLARRLERGELRPGPEDYSGLEGRLPGPTEVMVGVEWRSVLEAVGDFVVVADRGGEIAYTNPALRVALGRDDSAAVGIPGDELPLRWTARTGVPQRDIRLVFRSPHGEERTTMWQTAPLPGTGGASGGALAIGRDVGSEQARAQAREDQLAVAAHDLRAPVATILGHLQLARRVLASVGQLANFPEDPRSARSDPVVTTTETATLAPPWLPRLVRHLEMAESSTRDLIRSMETLLDASAAAAGALGQHLVPAPLDLRELFVSAVAQARSLSSRHRFVLGLPEEPVIIMGDSVRLREVFDNLLGNAVKFSPEGGQVEITLQLLSDLPYPSDMPDTLDVPGWVVASVADEGIGIPAGDLPRVFDRYWRGQGMVAAVRGSGLGLYTSRAIVAAHGGQIWVERTEIAEEEASDDQKGGWHGTVMAVALPLVMREEG
jgi:signal transduction histidine kinase